MTQASELSYSGDFLTAFANWRARFTVLLAHFLTARFRGSKFGIIFTLLEPLLWCWGLVLLRTLFRNTQPNYGTSLVLFYASGMFPFFLFMRISRRAVRVTTVVTTMVASAVLGEPSQSMFPGMRWKRARR